MSFAEIKSPGLSDWAEKPVLEGYLEHVVEKKGKYGVQRWARIVARDGETTEIPLTTDLEGKVKASNTGAMHRITYLEDKPTPAGSMKVFRVEIDADDRNDGTTP